MRARNASTSVSLPAPEGPDTIKSRPGPNKAFSPDARKGDAVHRLTGQSLVSRGMLTDWLLVRRLAAERFYFTTTTGNSATLFREFGRLALWWGLPVGLVNLTGHMAAFNLAGPAARLILRKLTTLDLEQSSFPYLGVREALVASVPCRIMRVGFVGELGYEINVPAEQGLELWERLIAVGDAYGITPYGTEAMHVLRAEKGYPMIGQETDGSVTPQDLGHGHPLARTDDFIGRRSLLRSDLVRADRRQLVGLLPDRPETVLPQGAPLVAEPGRRPPAMIGHVTSSYFGARIGRGFALALVEGGRARHGEPVFAALDGRMVAARIAAPVFYDPAGRRRDGSAGRRVAPPGARRARAGRAAHPPPAATRRGSGPPAAPGAAAVVVQ